MGRRRALVSSLKKAIICESKGNRKKKIRRSVKWFGKQRSIDLGSENEAAATASVPKVHSPTEEVKLINNEAENEQNMHAYSVALATAMAAEAAVAAAHAAAEVVRLRGGPRNSGKTKEEIAAIRIQTAFRGYMARRALRALRGLLRLKLIRGQSDKRQVSTLKCMETMARLQSDIRFGRIRISEENLVSQQQIQQKPENELEKSRVLSIGEIWDASLQSKEKIEENLQNRHEAAIRREKALAYAYSHQQIWKSSSNQSHTDLNNRGWSWLERWMAAGPWEIENAIVPEELTNDFDSPNSTMSRSVSAPSGAKIRSPRARLQNRPLTQTSKVGRKVRVQSPRRASVGTDDDSKSVSSEKSEQYRRHSTACSPLRDDESVTSSTSGVRSYMAPTESARAKLRGRSRLGLEKVGTPEKVPSSGSAKKRLSYTGSPAGGARRLSGPPKIDIVQLKMSNQNRDEGDSPSR